jgi:hypothetical protein
LGWSELGSFPQTVTGLWSDKKEILLHRDWERAFSSEGIDPDLINPPKDVSCLNLTFRTGHLT